MSKFSFLILVFFSVLISCNKQEDDDTCPSDIVCTEEYVSIDVNVELVSYTRAQISYSESFLEDSDRLVYTENYQREIHPLLYNKITVLGDSAMNDLKKSGSKIVLKVYDIEDREILSEKFVIGHDCCHVQKVSGPDKITL
jgi:hypothetical protein